MARTTVTNISGETRFFGYLPPHGVQLAHNASAEFDGDIYSVLASGRGRYSRKTELNALTEDVEGGVVSVETAPNPSSSSSA